MMALMGGWDGAIQRRPIDPDRNRNRGTKPFFFEWLDRIDNKGDKGNRGRIL